MKTTIIPLTCANINWVKGNLKFTDYKITDCSIVIYVSL